MKLKEIKFNVMYIPPIAAAIIIFISIIFFSTSIALVGNLILFAVLVGTLPYVLLSYLEYQQLKAVEEQFPVFLSDLAEMMKSGMTLPPALKQIGRTDYGKLSPQIERINNQMSWGIPAQEALQNFSERMKKSGIIRRVVGIIIESYNSGGDIARTMESTAEDMIVLRELERERQSLFSQHVVVMYAVYIIFIAIIIGLSKTLIPIIETNAGVQGLFSFQDPCSSCQLNPGLYCISCTVFNGVGTLFNIKGTGSYYNSVFLAMVVIQGIFTGLVVGQIGEGKLIAGVKHSLIMTSAGFAILMILFQSGFL